MGAAGVGCGDEVIVSPYNMSCSATCAFVYNAVPVFADLEPDCFCLDPESVRARITPRTKAIVAVSSFGQSADFVALRRIESNAWGGVDEDVTDAIHPENLRVALAARVERARSELDRLRPRPELLRRTIADRRQRLDDRSARAARALRHRANDAELGAVRDEVATLCSKFPPY